MQRETSMTDRNLLKVGIAGSIITALCCFTPLLVILLATTGLSAVIGYLDFVLFPALAAFLALTFYALRKRKVA